MKTSSDARALFEETFNGQSNFLTREIVSYGWVAKGRHAYEISKGEGITGGELWGVTILDADGTHRHDLSEAARSEQEVKDILRKIREIYR